MSDIAIRVENLNKQYRIGGPQARYPLIVSSKLTEEELKESLVIAERIIEKIRRLVEG